MKRRLLLVDDELAILLTLRAIFEINGFEVETAASAREAKQKIKNSRFHMVITDMRMESETAGREVVLAARNASYKPAVAMLTAFPIEGAGDSSEADEVLVKPMNTNDLLIQIEAMLVSHQDKQVPKPAPLVVQKKKTAAKKKAPAKKIAAKSKPRTAAKRPLTKKP
ncbi:response regulator [Silvibacterium acidisoli]|uniref:response regulator n=1 Tax=Acidobacteriaceae bacterium ZG23-2 TaxID=2883246 RepID=UPI00406C0676